MAYYLGIDGGGTKTRCALGDEATVVATTISGGCNIIRLGEAKARESLHAAIRQACSLGRVSLDQIQGICVGAAGAARPEVAAKLRGLIAELRPEFAASTQVVGDAEIALQAAFGSGPGVIAIAGTGSIAYARDSSGFTARAGGWGFAISDEGSGHWIGREAIADLLRARDEGRETALTAAILDAWKLNSIDALIQHANATPPPEFPRLFPVVVKVAEQGDAVARDLLLRAGTELAKACHHGTSPRRVGSRFCPSGHDGQRLSSVGGCASYFLQSSERRFPWDKTDRRICRSGLGGAGAGAHSQESER